MDALRRLVDSNATAQDKVNARARAAVLKVLSGFSGWYSPDEVTDMAREVGRVVAAAQRNMGALTDGYLAMAAEMVVGKRVTPAGVADDLGRDISPEEEWSRLAAEYRWQRSKGLDDAEAARLAATRATEMVSSDLLLAFTKQSRRFMVAKRVDGYRRIIRPELSRTGTCGLCIAAADQVYGRSKLLPVHSRCKCSVLPVINSIDPAGAVDLSADELQALYKAAGSTHGHDLKRTKYRIHDHSELGPQLLAA